MGEIGLIIEDGSHDVSKVPVQKEKLVQIGNISSVYRKKFIEFIENLGS